MTEQPLDLGPAQLSDRQLLEEIHAMLTTLTTAKTVKRRPAKVEYNASFLAAWAAYPRRDGSNPKKDAFQAWTARRKEGASPADMLSGARRYAAWCEANGNVGTGYVMQAVRFFGPNCHFMEPWTVEAAAIDWSRKDDTSLLKACRERNISTHGLTRFQIIERLQTS